MADRQIYGSHDESTTLIKNEETIFSLNEQSQKDTNASKFKGSLEAKMHITDLPTEVVQHILKYLSYNNIAKIRLVSRYFNNICSSLLNSEFYRLRVLVQQRFLAIKSQMPRRESSRRKHPLARESDIIETLYMRLTLLNMTFGKHIERKYCCFFPGEIIDEIYKILQYVEKTPCLSKAYKVTDELFDLSTMAMEYFKEHVEPSLPEVTYFASDVLEYPSFSSAKAKHSILEETVAANSLAETSCQSAPCTIQSLNKRLKVINRKVNRNTKEIGNIKRTVKVVSQKINSLGEVINEMKWQQITCDTAPLSDSHRINEILVQLNSCKHEIEQLTAKLSSCTDKSTNVDLESLEACLQKSTSTLNSIGMDDSFSCNLPLSACMMSQGPSSSNTRMERELRQANLFSYTVSPRPSIKRKIPCTTITSLDEYCDSKKTCQEADFPSYDCHDDSVS